MGDMRIIAFSRTIFILALVSGCATGAQQELARQNSIVEELKTNLGACSQKISNNPAYASLAKKMPLGGEEYSLEMLSDNTKPSKEMIAQLYALHSDIQPCRQITLDAAARSSPLRVVVYVEQYSASDKLWAEAVSGKLSWARFNQGRKDLAAAAQTKMAQVDSQIAGGLQTQHTVELEQRQRAAAAFQQWSYQQQALQQQQQAINAANRPRTIDCNYVGNTAQCNSY
jgi:hypothetical protein